MASFNNILGDLPDFSIKINGPVSSRLVGLNIHRFHDAVQFIWRLHYGRNSSKTDLNSVIEEQKGTCSTKHALIKTLLDEHEVNSIHLMLGIYKMNKLNTPGVEKVLDQHDLPYLPEAHNYLKYRGHRYDFTFPDTVNHEVFEYLSEEMVIEPQQIAKFKVEYHQNFLDNWIREEQLESRFSLSAIWEVREACIQHLSNKK